MFECFLKMRKVELRSRDNFDDYVRCWRPAATTASGRGAGYRGIAAYEPQSLRLSYSLMSAMAKLPPHGASLARFLGRAEISPYPQEPLAAHGSLRVDVSPEWREHKLSYSSIAEFPHRVLGGSRRKFRRWTSGNVRLLLPPRQSRGNSRYVLDGFAGTTVGRGRRDTVI